ncbi:MAG: nitroreductase family protein [Nitrosopumilus sp.]|nr:nitroreductase family protein [Nitrosopumilus sp.]
MDTFDCITSKIEVRDFRSSNSNDISYDLRLKILESARLTGSALNSQPWRFILVENKDNLKKLSEDSTSGKWVSGSTFAIIILTNPKYRFHLMDAGKVVQNMQLAAWNFAIGSGLYTGINEHKVKNDFNIPDDLNPTVIVGFGYPKNKIVGKKKKRLSIGELVSYEVFGNTSINIK